MPNTSVGSTAALGVAAVGGVGAACYLLSKASQNSVRTSIRKEAASPFEYHIVVHVPDGTDGGTCVLAKVPKSGDLSTLRAAVGAALELGSGHTEGMQLFPVLGRGRGKASLGAPLQGSAGLAGFAGILAQLPPDQLQAVEVLCVLQDSAVPTSAPPPPAPFPVPGPSLPGIGHTYVLFGPEFVYSYNITDWLFPPNAPRYPYGPTVRSYSGGKRSAIADFPPGTAFHPDAETYTTWSASADVAAELVARAAEFPKLWNRPAQKALQDFTQNGLFTSSETGDDWQAAHGILPRGFNQIKVKRFAPQILSKTRAFMREWSAFPAGHEVKDVNHWLTAMTADAVVACSMGMDMRNVERMGSGEPPHPFVDTFRFGLGFVSQSITAKSEFGLRRFIPGFGAEAKLRERYARAKESMNDMIEAMVEQTRSGELGGQESIIRAMLEDKASNGKHVRLGAVAGHVINLMIAGHETTAATLGFTMQLLAENPQCEERALAEAQSVMQGRTEPTADDVPKLQYIEQCFREALRLYSPVAMISRDAAHDTLLGGRRVFQGERINIVTRALHTNPEYWGGEFGDPYSFNPDRFSPEAVSRRHPNAYAPWGFGPRACIGSQFALFEAKTFLASLLMHFKLVAVPGYKLMASLADGGGAPAPHKLSLIVHPRPGGPLCAADGSMLRLPPAAAEPSPEQGGWAVARQQSGPSPRRAGGPPLHVLFGSNSGASQEFASQVARSGRRAGFRVSIATLDEAVKDGGALSPVDGRLVVVVTSTYNGNPPDNATAFKAWLAAQKEGSLEGLRFAVFGVGNSQWRQTFQQFPKEVDVGLARCGALRVHALGACDVDTATFDSDFDDWLDGLMRLVGGAADGEGAADLEDLEGLDEFVLEEPGNAGKELLLANIRAALVKIEQETEAMAKAHGIEAARQMLTVVEPSRELCQRADERSVRQVTLRLAEGSPAYRAGDHLEVLPSNDPGVVAMALTAIGVEPGAPVRWDASKGVSRHRSVRNAPDLMTLLPRQRVTAELVLQWVPDLTAVPSRKVVSRLARMARDDEARQRLQELAADAEKFKESVVTPQLSLAELLLRFKGQLKLPIGELCALAKPLAPRYYSVSSSPAGAADPRLVTVSVGQVHFKTGTGRVHRGLASTLLGSLPAGSCIPGSIRKLTGNFHLPNDLTAPMIMVGPGTGIAPMMGFLQERAHLLREGKQLGPAVLFFGCRRRDEDYLYKEELEGHLKSGALTELHVAFSREHAQKVYVQDAILEQRASVWGLLQHASATVYVCGDARAMAPDVRRSFQRVAEDCGGKSQAKAEGMLAAMVETGRYLEDVWAN